MQTLNFETAADLNLYITCADPFHCNAWERTAYYGADIGVDMPIGRVGARLTEYQEAE